MAYSPLALEYGCYYHLWMSYLLINMNIRIPLNTLETMFDHG